MGQHDGMRREPEMVEKPSSLEVTSRPHGWVDRLLNDVLSFDEMTFQPSDPPEEQDTIIGECTPYMKKLYAFSRHCEREADHTDVDLKHWSGEQNSQEHRSAKMMYEEMQTKHKMLRAMFWAEVNDKFHRWGDDSCLSVVNGWKVAAHSHSHSHDRVQRRDMNSLPPELMNLLKRLRSGGGGILGIGIEPVDPD